MRVIGDALGAILPIGAPDFSAQPPGLAGNPLPGACPSSLRAADTERLREIPRRVRSGCDEREKQEMRRHRAGNDARRATGCKRPVNHVDREASCGADADPLLFESRRADSPGGARVSDRPWFADAPEWRRGDEDEEPVFDGGDEGRIFDGGGSDWLRGGCDEFGGPGGVDRGAPLCLRRADTAHPGDEEDALRWGKRRIGECLLNYLGGDGSVSCLGDGEDLP